MEDVATAKLNAGILRKCTVTDNAVVILVRFVSWATRGLETWKVFGLSFASKRGMTTLVNVRAELDICGRLELWNSLILLEHHLSQLVLLLDESCLHAIGSVAHVEVFLNVFDHSIFSAYLFVLFLNFDYKTSEIFPLLLYLSEKVQELSDEAHNKYSDLPPTLI